MQKVASKDLKTSIQIIFATTTGNSEVLAEETAVKFGEVGLENKLCSTEDFSIDKFYEIETLLAFISTDNHGLPPMAGEDLFQSLRNKTKADLEHLSYAVLALGDSYYPNFCQAGKDFDHMLEKLGACRIIEREDCDLDYWKDYGNWIDKVLSVLGKKEKTLSCNV